MIFRLEYKNKALKTARVDIVTPTGTGVETVEGTGYPFQLKYEGDKKNKSLMFLSSSAEINIYETPLFNIDTLKTSGEKDIRVNYYIDSVLEWTGFVIPDFFSREIGGDGVVSMVASDRLSVLDSEVLEGLPVTVTLRTLLSLSLAKTGLTLPLKTVVDFATVSGNTNHVLNHSIRSQRLTDTKGRSVNCKDIIKSILVATNSKIMQRKGEWWVVNKMQHELGGGRVYTSPTAFTNYVEDLISFTDVTRGAMRTIAPVAGGVGVFQEYGGGKLIPDNYNFKNGLTGWTNYNGFVSSTNNRRVLGYTQSGSIFTPIYDDAGTSEPYLVNRNISPIWVLFPPPSLGNIPLQWDPYAIKSTRIISPVISGDSNAVKVTVDVNAVGLNNSFLPFSVVLKRPGRENLFLNRSNEWQPRAIAQLLSFKNDNGGSLAAVSAGMSVSAVITADSSGEVLDDVGTYTIEVLIFGSGIQGDNAVGDNTTLINSASVQFSAASNDTPKGTLYKADQGGESYTKIHDTETTVFGDYLTGGLNGYFYNYAPDDTSSLLAPNGSRSQPAWVNTYTQNTEPLPLLQQTIRQMRRMFSVAHDFIKGEIDVSDFDPLSVFEDCERRFVIVEAEFDFLRGSLQVVLEEVAYQNLTVREYIYSYFGEGDEGIRGISGISAGSSGGGGGGGVAPEPSWLENEITIDSESGLLSVDGWHVKGDLIIEGQVNQWLAQQLVVDDARIQVNRRQGGATVDSGLVIHDRDTGLEVSSLVYDVNGIWRAGGQRIFTDDYNPMLGGYSAASYPRKAEGAVVTGKWTFSSGISGRAAISDSMTLGSDEKTSLALLNDGGQYGLFFGVGGTGRSWIQGGRRDGSQTVYDISLQANGGNVAIGRLVAAERLHVAGNGLFTGNISAVNAALSGTLDVTGASTLTGAVTAGGDVGGAGTFVSGFAGSNWRLEQANNHLTVDSLTVRGQLSVYELVVNQIRATNGSLWVSDSMKTTTIALAAADIYRISFDTDNGRIINTFSGNDIVKAQRFDGKNIVVIVGRVVNWDNAAGWFQISTSGYTAPVGTLSNFVGLEFVRIGNTSNTDRQGALYLTSSDSNAPYMDVLDGVNSASFAGKTKARLGRLDGITDADLGTLSGYGLYSENAYLKGKIVANSGLVGGASIEDGGIGTNVDNNKFIGMISRTTSNAIINSYDSYLRRGFGIFNYDSATTAGGFKLMRMGMLTSKDTWGTWPSTPNYGIQIGTGLGSAYRDVFRVDSSGAFIAGINFDDSRIYTENWELNKDGSFYFGAGGTIDGGLIAGSIESANWDGTVGSRLNLLDGSLEFGNVIRIDAVTNQVVVKDGGTGQDGVKIGDFTMSGGVGSSTLDNAFSGSITTSANSENINLAGTVTPTGLSLTQGLVIYSNIAQGVYNLKFSVKVNTLSRNSQAYSTIPAAPWDNNGTYGSATTTIKVFLGANIIYSSTKDCFSSEVTHDINISFEGSGTLRCEVSIDGTKYYQFISGGSKTLFGYYGVISTNSARITLTPSANLLEISSKGFQSYWGPSRFFRLAPPTGWTNFLTARGQQEYISPNGTYRLKVSDAGIQKSTNGGQDWTTL